jgi:hypothetical protein
MGCREEYTPKNRGFKVVEESLKKSLIRESEKTLFGLLFLISDP